MIMRPIVKLENEHLLLEVFPIGDLDVNCSLITHRDSQEALIIDPGNDFATTWEILQKRQVHLKLILQTHGHFDHLGQSARLKKESGAPLYLHPADDYLYQTLAQQGNIFGAQVFYDPQGITGPLSDGQ
ncbi:MAG: MBL fold metallo-hydrolase, partial [Pseudomonadota bacterium]